jgi:hypothetical protein
MKSWDVSEVSSFENLFSNCELLEDVMVFEHWTIKDSVSYTNILNECKSLFDISPLKNIIINGKMDKTILKTTKIGYDEKWNKLISNGNNDPKALEDMFYQIHVVIEKQQSLNKLISSNNEKEAAIKNLTSKLEQQELAHQKELAEMKRMMMEMQRMMMSNMKGCQINMCAPEFNISKSELDDLDNF